MKVNMIVEKTLCKTPCVDKQDPELAVPKVSRSRQYCRKRDLPLSSSPSRPRPKH